jgi:hypothetical protein
MKTLLTFLVIVICLPEVCLAACIDNLDFQQNLPTAIGREEQVGKFPFALQCDTVFVRKGVTTVIYPGTMLFFSRPSINSLIKVEGTLILKGTRNSYITLSASLDSSRNGAEPGIKQWSGIEVAEGGRLEMEYVGLMKAPTPITTFSNLVRIVNSWFKGSSGIVLPDGSIYPMESTWHTINNMDFSKDPVDRKALASPVEALSEREKFELRRKSDALFWTWKRAGAGVAAFALVGVGVAFLLPSKPETSPVHTASRDRGFSAYGLDTLTVPSK